MNVFERVEKLNARIRELETQLRAYELEKALREIHDAIADGNGDYSPSGDWFKETAAILAKATGQEI
jgi:hypothetical protein